MKPRARLDALGEIRRMRAIMRREIGSRYAGDTVGYLWAYIFPLSWMAVIYLAFIAFGRTSPIDTDIVSFLLSGVLPYLGTRFVINAVVRARTAYRHILILPQVDITLVIFSIFLLELANGIAMFSGLLLLNYAVFGFFEMADPGLVLWGFFLAIGSGGAFGFLLVALARISPVIPKSNPIFLRPLFYISGVFFVANELPLGFLTAISWNPLFHAVELLREGMFAGYHSVLANGWVPVAFIGACLALGLIVLNAESLPFEGESEEELI
ncbi:ABC transporter permease [Sphingomicrobium nitratireducens]|uniref:ABC transporter permease n=1 Tax=Sphingomicrobium nitratireducens TaxID=2964666 RepID=UPI00223FFB92|nr:ABC transporter permease [Sphingomicrobium nitratireducens]